MATLREILSQMRSRGTVMSEHDLALLAGSGLYGGQSASISLPSAQTIATGAPQAVIASVLEHDDLGFTGTGAPSGGFIIPTLAPDQEIDAIQLTVKCLWNPDVDGGRSIFTTNTGAGVNAIANTIAADGGSVTFGVSWNLVSGPIKVAPGDVLTLLASHGSAGNIDLFSATFGIIVLR